MRGSAVTVVNDGDNAEGIKGKILSQYKSGRFCVELPSGGFRNLAWWQIMFEKEIETRQSQIWQYETDEFEGVCIIAKDAMRIKFRFEAVGNRFFDVLKIKQTILNELQIPVSVEGMVDVLTDAFPGLTVTASGRAESHGWITSTSVID